MGVHFWASQVSLSRVSIEVDMLICWLSESSLLVWILEVSLIVTIKVRAQSPRVWLSKDLIIKHESLIIKNNQVFHHVSPNFSYSGTGPNLTVDRIKIEYHLRILNTVTIHHTPPGLSLTVTKERVNRRKKLFWNFWGSHFFSLLLVRTSDAVESHRGPSDGGSAAQKHAPAPLPDVVRAKKEEFHTH